MADDAKYDLEEILAEMKIVSNEAPAQSEGELPPAEKPAGKHLKITRMPFRPPENEQEVQDDEEILYSETEEEPAEAERASFDFVNRVYADADEAVSAITRRLQSAGLRVMLMLPTALAALYMTLAPTLSLPMPFGFTYIDKPFLYLLVFFALDAFALLLDADVSAAGLYRLIKGSPTMDTLVLFCSLSSMAYILTVLIKPSIGGWLPYTAVTCCTNFFALIGKRRRYASLKRTYRIIQLDPKPAAVKLYGKGRFRTAYKSEKNVFPEMDDIALPDRTERFSLYYAPLAIVAAIALSAAASFGRHDPSSFVWCLSALLCMTVTPAMLISSALPGSLVSRRLYSSGSAIVSSRATSSLFRARAAVLGDDDIFPVGSVSVTSLKIMDDFSLEYIYSVTSSVLAAIGGGLYSAFEAGAKQIYAQPLNISDVRFFENGGLSAKADGKYVLIGTASFLTRMGVSVMQGVKLHNCIFVAVESKFAGVFSLKYTAQTPVYCGFRFLRRAKMTPVLAVRDPCVTADFAEERFDLRANTVDFPSTEERVHLSRDALPSTQSLGILSRSSMFSFSEMLLAARKLWHSVTFNIVCSLLSSFIGLVIMYFLVSNMEAASASPSNILVYLFCWAMPVWLSSLIFTAF